MISQIYIFKFMLFKQKQIIILFNSSGVFCCCNECHFFATGDIFLQLVSFFCTLVYYLIFSKILLKWTSEYYSYSSTRITVLLNEFSFRAYIKYSLFMQKISMLICVRLVWNTHFSLFEIIFECVHSSFSSLKTINQYETSPWILGWLQSCSLWSKSIWHKSKFANVIKKTFWWIYDY